MDRSDHSFNTCKLKDEACRECGTTGHIKSSFLCRQGGKSAKAESAQGDAVLSNSVTVVTSNAVKVSAVESTGSVISGKESHSTPRMQVHVSAITGGSLASAQALPDTGCTTLVRHRWAKTHNVELNPEASVIIIAADGKFMTCKGSTHNNIQFTGQIAQAGTAKEHQPGTSLTSTTLGAAMTARHNKLFNSSSAAAAPPISNKLERPVVLLHSEVCHLIEKVLSKTPRVSNPLSPSVETAIMQKATAVKAKANGSDNSVLPSPLPEEDVFTETLHGIGETFRHKGQHKATVHQESMRVL